MSYFLLLLGICFVLGMVGVASNPSPYYGTLGLVVCVLGGCGVLVVTGGSYLGLVLLLIYLGGMMVVFAYSVALASDPFPEAWGAPNVFMSVLGYGAVIVFLGAWFVDVVPLVGPAGGDGVGLFGSRADFNGVVLMFLEGGPIFLLCGWGLLLALLVVLELVRGGEQGALRVP
uniref:NADH-ubiquinone oxidoreductase chain 6 n=1 Tax=Stenodactylus petrii TaxID=401535 RepID=A0A0A1H7I1_9SAUR|nr:NADH dehydrogenase subunit 6 [Stenodactylus petrii]